MYHQANPENRSVLASLRALIPQRPLTFAETLRITELQANRLLELNSVNDGPVPTSLITAMPRLRVRYRRYLPVSGVSQWNSDSRQWMVTLNADEPHCRQRFTLMHEYAHIISHGSGQNLFTGTCWTTPEEQAERAADYFAGCLLLPKRLLKSAWGNGLQRRGQLAAAFDVSERAVAVRLSQIGPRPTSSSMHDRSTPVRSLHMTQPVADTSTAPAQAVAYLRVSTRDQAERGGEAEGFSIPAQREACKRKAEALGAVIVAEFVDRGESARSANRPELQRLLDYVTAHPVTYAIVHKVDRLARNRFDDVAINASLGKAGVQLVSCTENIDDTPGGMLLHGIMSSIAEFYSRNLATETRKGMRQKAKAGGTPGMAPFGYLNIRSRDAEGREVRTVAVDPERAEVVKWIFESYASGDWTASITR